MKVIAEGKRIGMVCFLIILITFFGFFLGLARPDVQAVLAHAYYVPIVLAGIWFGLKGGLLAALACGIVLLLPGLAHHGSISLGVPQGLEMAMYCITGCLTGILVRKTTDSKSKHTPRSGESRQTEDVRARQMEKSLAIENELRAADRLAVMGVWGHVLAAGMKGPLDTMRQILDKARKEIISGGSPAELFQASVKEINQLNGTIERFLLVTKSKKQKMIECDLNEIVQSTVDLLAGQARQKQIDLIMVRPSRPIAIFADVTLMHQALLNVILQSMASLEAGGRIVISPSAKNKGHEETRRSAAQVAVSDTGRGMTPSQLEHVFEPLHSGGDQPELGMAVARWAVEQMRGEIRLESVEGTGTTVTITIPCAEEKEKQAWGSFSKDQS